MKNSKFTGELLSINKISMAKNATFLGYYFYLKTNIKGDFNISIHVSQQKK